MVEHPRDQLRRGVVLWEAHHLGDHIPPRHAEIHRGVLELSRPVPAAALLAKHLAGGPGATGQHRGADERTPVLADCERGDGAFSSRTLVKAVLIRLEDARERLEHLVEAVDPQVDDMPPGLFRVQLPASKLVARLPRQRLAALDSEHPPLAADFVDLLRAEHLHSPPERDNLSPPRVRPQRHLAPILDHVASKRPDRSPPQASPTSCKMPWP